MNGFDRFLSMGNQKDVARVNRVEGFTGRGEVVAVDARGSRRAEIPTTKSETLGDDPLAIYKPTGAKNVDAAKAMGSFSGWVFAAVNAIASEVANVQFRLYQINGADHEEQDSHDLLTLLEGVNETMTGIELKYVTVSHLELTGNCYWLLDGVKSEEDQPRAIYPLNPGRVRVKLNKTTFPYKISHYEFTIDGKVFTFQPYQILHFKYPDPGDPYVGIGVPQTIPVWIDSDNYAMEYNRKFFINGAALGLYIATQTNVEGNLDRIRKGFDNRHAGIENAHKVPVLPKGVDLKSAGASNRDMDFANLADTTRDRILAGFRVSKTILGTAESDTNRSTAETADYVFSKRTIKPKMLLILSYLNEFLVPRYGDDIYLTFIDPVPEDKAFRTEEMKAATGGAPVMTANEARKNYMGLGPVDGGDDLMGLTTMEPLGQTPPGGEDPTPNLAKGEKRPVIARAMTEAGFMAKAVRVRTGGKSTFSGSQKMRKDLVAAFAAALDTEEYVSKALKDLTKEEYMEHYKRFDHRSRQAVKEIETELRQINAEQRKEVLENLPDVTGLQKALPRLFDVTKWISATIDLMTPILERLTKDEAAAALAMIGGDLSINILDSADVRAALDTGIMNMARSYTETTLSQLSKAIGDQLASTEGTSLAKITDAVDGVYEFADERRASMIAKTEAYRAANQANLSAWDKSGVVSTVKWFTAEDGSVCPECADLDGKIVDVGRDFFTADYGDGNSPPLHPDCRCYLRPEDVSI